MGAVNRAGGSDSQKPVTRELAVERLHTMASRRFPKSDVSPAKRLEANDELSRLEQVVRTRTWLLRTLPEADQKDAVQETLRMAWERWDEIAGYTQGRREGWAITVAKRRAVDQIRRCKRERRLADRLHPATYCYDTEDVLDRLPSHFTAEFARLPQRQQQVVTMHYLMGMTVDEVAEELGISANSVKTYRKRAMRTLRTYSKRFGLGRED